MTSIDDFVDRLNIRRDYNWAFNNFKLVVERAIDEFGCQSILEIGGGRRPLLTPAEISLRSLSYTVNDVDQSELDRLGGLYDDVLCADLTSLRTGRRYDLMFSRFVYEHVADNRRSLENQFAMLKEGGLIIHFHPVLYALPFVVNYVLDDRVSKHIHSLLYGRGKIVKYPAHYDWCVVSDAQRDRLLSVGFSEAALVPIYGHHYYGRLPIVRDVHRWISALLESRDCRMFASYCFTIAKK